MGQLDSAQKPENYKYEGPKHLNFNNPVRSQHKYMLLVGPDKLYSVLFEALLYVNAYIVVSGLGKVYSL